MIRQPIIVVMGHVDHGKTSLLDKIRNTTIAAKEAGGITQHIGASEVPLDAINTISKSIINKFKIEIKIPGLLFIDTPGHEAFTNLRRRGGSVADLAILVVDVSKSFEEQTYEAIEILKEYKTPFIVAANKIDLITGWQPSGSYSFLEAIEKQNQNVVLELDKRVYDIVYKLSELGFNSERFDRVREFSKEVMIIPISAKTGEGLAELLLYTAGLAQRFLEMQLKIEVNGPGIGSILEKKEEKGLGTTIDVILFNGSLSVNDVVAFATPNGIKEAKIKALLRPKPLQELRESLSKFYYIDRVSAAAGIKISGNGFEEAIPGSLIVSTSMPDYAKMINAEISEVFATDKTGIVVKADSIGGLEALSKLLNKEGFKISKKGIGNVTKNDILDAFAMKKQDPYSSFVLAFNVDIEPDAKELSNTTGVKVLTNDIIYRLIEDFKKIIEEEKKNEIERIDKSITHPAKIFVLPNARFRISHPAIFGVKVEKGKIKPSDLLMNKNGDLLGRIREIQSNGISLNEAKSGDEVAISIDDIVFGRHVNENDILYTFINDDEERELRYKLNSFLNDEEKDVLNEISEIKKKRKLS